MTPLPTRERPPTSRVSETFDAAIAGHRIHMTVGYYDDGRPCELALEVHKEGAVLRGVFNALARSVSAGLQNGVPISVYVEDWIGQRFEPQGATDDPDVPEATSFLDWMGRTLAARYDLTLPG